MPYPTKDEWISIIDNVMMPLLKNKPSAEELKQHRSKSLSELKAESTKMMIELNQYARSTNGKV